MSNPRIIAFTGKGGVGKTSISAITIRILKETYPDKKILAIDADPAVGLSTALGVEAKSTVDDIRKFFIDNVNKGNTKAAVELLGEAKYQISDALIEMENVSFLAIGRPESAGCYCKVNAYLKEVISRIASNFDYVVIDGEAGIEQVNRRVMDSVTDLILVSDASKKGLEVVKTIYDVALKLVKLERTGLIINRLVNVDYLNQLDTKGLNILSSIIDDKNMVILIGKDLNEIKEDTPYARIALINLDESKIGTGKDLYNNLMKIDYIRYHVHPSGFMTRISSMNEVEGARVAKSALKKGINFSKVGSLYIKKYHSLPFVKNVKLFFINELDYPYLKIKELINKEKGITHALDHLSSKIKMDCHSCSLQAVCKEVEELTNKEFKKE